MPNLKDWTEDKIRRGYSREAIKRHLLKSGYSKKAVAEVDKLTYNRDNKKKLSQITVILLLIAAISLSLIYFNQGEKKEEKVIEKIVKQETTTVQKEKILMQKFIEENLMPDYQHSSLELSELPIVPTPDNTRSGKAYGAEWDGKWRDMSINFFALIQYNFGNKDINYYGVSIKMPMVLDVLNESNAYSIHGIFFKNEDIDWTCGKIMEANTCKIIKTSEDKTKRADIIRESPENLILLSRYNYPTTSEMYENIE